MLKVLAFFSPPLAVLFSKAPFSEAFKIFILCFLPPLVSYIWLIPMSIRVINKYEREHKQGKEFERLQKAALLKQLET